MRLDEDVDGFLLVTVFLFLLVLSLDDFRDPCVSTVPLSEALEDAQARHTPLALWMFAGIWSLALPLELIDDKLFDRRVFFLFPCRPELNE